LGKRKKRRHRQNKSRGVCDPHTKNPTLRTRIPTLALCSFGARLTIEKTLNFPIQRFFYRLQLNGLPQIKRAD
jgi:hypothetical protein